MLRTTLLVLLFIFSIQASATSDVEIENLAPGVWIHTSYYTYPNGVRFPSNGLIVQDGQGLILIDTAWGELATVALLKEINTRLTLPVTAALVTHSHADRLAGTDVLKTNDIPVYAHPLTIKLASEYGLPVPDKSLDKLATPQHVIRLGRLDVVYPGAGHTADNLMVWLPKEKVLFGGCAVRGKGATSIGNIAHSDVGSWHEAMKYISREYQSAETVIPGHGEIGDFSLISNTLYLVNKATD